MAGSTMLGYCTQWQCNAWILRPMAGGAMLGYRAQWLARCFIFAPDGGTMLAKELKAESEQVMEHHLLFDQISQYHYNNSTNGNW